MDYNHELINVYKNLYYFIIVRNNIKFYIAKILSAKFLKYISFLSKI